MVAKKVNERYKVQGTFNASTIFGDTHQIGSGLGAAFSEGLSQLKDSISGAVNSVKNMTQHQQAPMINQSQQPVMNQQPLENVEQTTENGSHPVSLKK